MGKTAKVEDKAMKLSAKDETTPKQRNAMVAKTERAVCRQVLKELPVGSVEIEKGYLP